MFNMAIFLADRSCIILYILGVKKKKKATCICLCLGIGGKTGKNKMSIHLILPRSIKNPSKCAKTSFELFRPVIDPNYDIKFTLETKMVFLAN